MNFVLPQMEHPGVSGMTNADNSIVRATVKKNKDDLDIII